jgi:predicted RNase H-like nuclease (RuvC/YqgF family)
VTDDYRARRATCDTLGPVVIKQLSKSDDAIYKQNTELKGELLELKKYVKSLEKELKKTEDKDAIIEELEEDIKNKNILIEELRNFVVKNGSKILDEIRLKKLQ